MNRLLSQYTITQATHVGVVRSINGNGPNIIERLSAHRIAVYAVLHAGLARGHRANPAATLRVEKLYGLSVLLSGMASLVLSNSEEAILDQHYKVHLQRLLKLNQATPAPVVYFLSGCLPLRAHLHIRMFTLFGQLCRLRDGDNILARQAITIYSSSCTYPKSWFWKIRLLCLQYGLPHPASWIMSKPSKVQVKSMIRSAVTNYWLVNLHAHAVSLSSLRYLRTNYLGLTRCHPMFIFCGSSTWEVEKVLLQARLLSGRFCIEALSGHWVSWNKDGLCTLPEGWNTPDKHKGTVEEFLLSCSSLSPTRRSLSPLLDTFMSSNPDLAIIIRECLSADPVQFWLDCSTMLPVIIAVHLF